MREVSLSDSKGDPRKRLIPNPISQELSTRTTKSRSSLRAPSDLCERTGTRAGGSGGFGYDGDGYGTGDGYGGRTGWDGGRDDEGVGAGDDREEDAGEELHDVVGCRCSLIDDMREEMRWCLMRGKRRREKDRSGREPKQEQNRPRPRGRMRGLPTACAGRCPSAALPTA